MDILKLFNELHAAVESAQLALADAQLAAEQLGALKFAEGAASRDEEVAGLLARIAELEAIDPEKKYSQAELDQAVSDAVTAAVQLAVDEAKAALKTSFQALLDAEEVDLEEKLKAL